ncbi:hypothetical protein SUGI_0739990 [Cryptomeria japonica]|nr:hypothetical protein SUGI_0739990 [Cryptomeria japonica]
MTLKVIVFFPRHALVSLFSAPTAASAFSFQWREGSVPSHTSLPRINGRGQCVKVGAIELQDWTRDYIFVRRVISNKFSGMLMHGADRDIIWLQRDFGIYICNLFDMGQVLATSTKKSDDNGSLESEKTHNNDSFGEDDEGMIVNSKKVEGSEFISSCLHKVDKGDQLPRYRARVFAAKVILIFLSGPSFLYPSPVEPVSRERESRGQAPALRLQMFESAT